jgi:Methane oxygenase PmoA
MVWYDCLSTLRLALTTLCLANAAVSAEEIKVVVAPGGLNPRDGTTVIPYLPKQGDVWDLVDSKGNTFQVIRCGDHTGRALLPPVTQPTIFTARPGTEALPKAAFTITQTGDDLHFLIAEREVIAFVGGKGYLPDGYEENYRRAGYLSRLSTPSGRLVTDDYPPNHKHHHGLWFAWTLTNYDGRQPDFWNMGTGKAGVQSLDHAPVWTAGPWAGFSYRNRYQDKTSGKSIDVLEEHIDLVARAPLPNDPVVIIDFIVSQQCLTTLPLLLPAYHYGGLGLRGNRDWNGAKNATFLTSAGLDRSSGNATRANWVHMGGMVNGKPAGTAVLCHPNNFRAPQSGRIHPTEPFFCFAPSQLGDWSIRPGIPYQMRYRLIIADGLPDAADLERRWQEYAHPPLVTWDGKTER